MPMPFVRLAPLSLVLLAGCVPMAAPDVPVTTSNLVSSSGAVIGTAVQQRLPERAISLMFAALLIVIAVKLVVG